MVQQQCRHMAFVGAGAALSVLLAACGGGDQGAAGPSPTAPTTSPRATGTNQSASPSSQRQSSPQSSAPSAATTTPSKGGAEQVTSCTAEDIKVTLGKGGAAAGSYFAPLRFTNTSDTPCVVGGHPGVSYVAGQDAHQVGPPAERITEQWQPVTVEPDKTAHATVRFLQVRNYETGVCQPTSVRALRVYSPGETAATLVPYSGTGCASNDIPGEQLTIKPVRPGPGGNAA